MASAADEAAQHHNWPSSLPHVIVVNSVRNPDEVTPLPKSYLRFNGCTNFSSKISLAIPSTSCSSNAVGLAAGMAGLVYSAALNAHEASPSRLAANGSCHRIDGSACMITPNEVGQLMAAGRVGSTPQADDVNFASGNGGSEPVCGGQTPAPPLCTDPNSPALRALVDAAHPVLPGLVATRAYPARKGHDQFYGYGRVNMWNAVHAVDAGDVPPEVSIESPDWYAQVDPGQAGLDLRGRVAARGAAFTCRVLVAPGSYPNDDDGPRRRLRGRSLARRVRRLVAHRRDRRDAGARLRRDPEVAVPGDGERLRGPGVRPRQPADLERPAEHRQVRLHREGGRDGRGRDRP